MIDLDDAVSRVVRAAEFDVDADIDAGVDHLPIDDDALRGRVLAADLRLDRDHPPFDRATMDGIACRAADARPGADLAIVGDLAAGGVPPSLSEVVGTAIRIATGAAVPTGFDTVVERERLESLPNDRVRIATDATAPGRNIHPRGADGRANDLLVPAGTRLDPIAIGLAASVGCGRIPVRRRPRVAILATGDELRAPGDPLDGPDDAYRIRDGNRPMLAATLASLGADVVATDRVADDLEATVATLDAVLCDAEIVITIGGVSAGDRDHVPAAAERLGLTPCFRGVRIQPGRPTAAWCDGDGRLRLVGLPGNPVSCLVAAHLVVRPWIEARLGLVVGGDWSERTLTEDVRANPSRTACRPAIADGRDVRVPGWHGSGDGPHLVGTTGIVRLSQQDAPIPAGTRVPYLSWTADPRGTGS